MIGSLLVNRGASKNLSEEIKSIEFDPKRDRLQKTRAPATRIFSPLAVAGLCVTIGHYWYLFRRLTAVTAGRFYRFEHIDTYSSGKVVASKCLSHEFAAKERSRLGKSM
jgi:hypothetical protein